MSGPFDQPPPGSQPGYPSYPAAQPAPYPTVQPGYPGYSGYSGYPAGSAGYPAPSGWSGPMPPVWGDQPPPMPPGTVLAALWCWIAAAVSYVAGIVLHFVVEWPAWIAELQRPTHSRGVTSVANANLVGRLTVGMFVFVVLVAVVPHVVAAIKLRSGRHWARVLLGVLGGLGVLIGLGGVLAVWAGTSDGDITNPTHMVIVVTQLVLTVAATVLTFLPPTNRYVAALRRTNR